MVREDLQEQGGSMEREFARAEREATLRECRIERAIAGEREATDRLVAALRPRLARMAAYYARCSGEEADDLLQEAWVGLLEALPHLDVRIGSPDQYLIQRARWRLLDAIKRASVRRCLPLEEEAIDRLPGRIDETALELACAWEFAARLKPMQRAVLACLLSGLTWREAARALGCSAGNIAYHVRQLQRCYTAWNAAEETEPRSSGGPSSSPRRARKDRFGKEAAPAQRAA
jgi:RNA polymerase sigma-70 factor (ECF subfamily)